MWRRLAVETAAAAQDAAELAFLSRGLSRDLRGASRPHEARKCEILADRLTRIHERLSRLHSSVLGTTQPLDADPRLELHVRLPWAEEPPLSADGVTVLHDTNNALMALTPTEQKAVVYALANRLLRP